MATAKDTTKTVKKPAATKPAKKEVAVESSKEFAVILTGGKQYRVAVGDTLKVEKLEGKFELGDKIIFDKVLLVDNGVDTTIGSPYITNATVESLFQKHGRGQTVKVVKYKQKSRYLKRNGHRQPFIEVKISAIK
jgi:large subunit ribosomal protein L21